MRVFYQCAKIAQSLQHKAIICFGLIVFFLKRLNVFNLSAATKNLITNYTFSLTLLWWWYLSYRNKSIDLQGKSMEWFLYDKDLRHERVKPTCFLLIRETRRQL